MGCCLAKKKEEKGKKTRRSAEKRLQFMCGGVECSSPRPGHIAILAPARDDLHCLDLSIVSLAVGVQLMFLLFCRWMIEPASIGKIQTMLQWSRKVKLQRAQAVRAGAQHDPVIFFSTFPISVLLS